MATADKRAPRTLRERKRERTRAAIVAAGTDLFERRGYDATTIADIAAAADIGTRTFFGYFASKEELLFPENDRRVEAALQAIATPRAPEDSPLGVLFAALTAETAVSDELVSRTAALRMRLMETVPAVRGRSLQMQREAQRKIAGALCAAYPDELDAARATALVGALIGATAGALEVILDDPKLRGIDSALLVGRLREAVAYALAGGGSAGRGGGCGEPLPAR